jgi:uncharacterized membrane protein YqjE
MDRPISQVVQDIAGNIQEIFRSEIRLAKEEVRQEGSKAARAGVVLAGGAVLGLYALGFLLLSAVYALAIALPWWLAALIVGVVVGIAAAVLIVTGRDRLHRVNPPQRTIETMKENVQWAREQMR